MIRIRLKGFKELLRYGKVIITNDQIHKENAVHTGHSGFACPNYGQIVELKHSANGHLFPNGYTYLSEQRLNRDS